MTNSNIFIGADHAGFELKKTIKKFLMDEGYNVEDVGPYEYDKEDDYPDFAEKLCIRVLESGGRGILICGTGQGMSRSSNKIPGIVAEVCWNEDTALHAAEHSNANVLTFGQSTVDKDTAISMVKIWLEIPFKNEERHIRRFQKVIDIEKRYK